MPWTCSESCAHSRGLPVPIAVDFNETAVVRLLFGARTRDPKGEDVPHGGTKIVSQQREPRGAPRCSYCEASALWQEGEETPIRRIADLTAEMLYQHNEHVPFVQFRGAYVPSDLVDELVSCGWKRPDWYSADLSIPQEFLLDGLDTDTFELPYILRSEIEAAEPMLTALRATCVKWGVPLAGPRRRTLAEQL
jgi:hypothetical protein